MREKEGGVYSLAAARERANLAQATMHPTDVRCGRRRAPLFLLTCLFVPSFTKPPNKTRRERHKNTQQPTDRPKDEGRRASRPTTTMALRKIERFSETWRSEGCDGSVAVTTLRHCGGRDCQSRTMTDGLSQLDAVNLIKFMSVHIFRGKGPTFEPRCYRPLISWLNEFYFARDDSTRNLACMACIYRCQEYQECPNNVLQ